MSQKSYEVLNLSNMSKIYAFWRPAFNVLSGVALAQLIPILAYLYLASLLGPEGFGYFSIWLGIVSLGAVISTLRLENALFIEDETSARLECFSILISIVLGIGVILLALLLIVEGLNPKLLPNIPASLWYALIPSIAVLAINTSLQFLAVAEGDYKRVNRLRVIQAGAITISQLVATSISANAFAMAVAFLFGQSCSVVYGYMSSRQNLIFHFSYRKVKRILTKHWRFPVFSLPAGSLSGLGALLPVVFFGSQFGPVAAGQLALTIRILGGPVNWFGKAVQDVFKRQAVIDIKASGNCKSLYFNVLLVLIPVMVVFIAGVYFVAPVFFATVFGAEWEPSGQMAQILAPIFALGLAAIPLSHIIYLVGKQHFDLIWQGALICIIILALGSFSSQFETLVAYACGYSLMYLVYLVISYNLCSYIPSEKPL